MTLTDLLAQCRSRPDDGDCHGELAREALAIGEELQALPLLHALVERRPADPRGWHWLGLLCRGLDRRREAIVALGRAHELTPNNGSIAHGLAHVMLEAGEESVAAFERAIALTPGNPAIRLGLASARVAAGHGALARSELADTLAANPGWIEGHRHYAQLAALTGDPAPLATIEAALVRFPDGGELYLAAIDLLIDGDLHDAALAMMARARARLGDDAALDWSQAAALDELGESVAAKSAFDRLDLPGDPAQAVRLVRHLLRRGEPGPAVLAIEPWLAGDGAGALWPYASIAWRMLGDPRAQWLDQDRFIAEIDLGLTPAELAELAALLRSLHQRSGRFLNQSVRAGTQTDGPLLARIDPPIERLRHKLRAAIADYVAALPPPDAGHPLLMARRHGRLRFAGSWSVRLTDRGYHSAHHHPQGWISSAFYVTVPEGMAAGAGWLELGGGPPALRLDLPPTRRIAPIAGKLVLFPSTVWHSTTPFEAGERISVAFDVAQPSPNILPRA